jgi:hypothetical protein
MPPPVPGRIRNRTTPVRLDPQLSISLNQQADGRSSTSFVSGTTRTIISAPSFNTNVDRRPGRSSFPLFVWIVRSNSCNSLGTIVPTTKQFMPNFNEKVCPTWLLLFGCSGDTAISKQLCRHYTFVILFCGTTPHAQHVP